MSYEVNPALYVPAEPTLVPAPHLVARQPIYDRNEQTFAYELLFRDPETLEATFDDPDRATAQVIVNSFVRIGMERMVGQSKAFINVTREFILGDHCRSLPRDRMVFELLETTRPDTDLLTALTRHCAQGYQFALDDFAFQNYLVPLIRFCAYVKVDLRRTDRETIRSHASSLRQLGVKLLAEKIETAEEFRFCREAGFDYFQGYYFSKPKLFSATEEEVSAGTLSVGLLKLAGIDSTSEYIQ